MPNDLESSGAKHVIFVVRKGLGGGDYNGVSSVCTERVKVFHVTANDGVLRATVGTGSIRGLKAGTHIGTIPHHFVLEFLPALHTPLDQNLRAQAQTPCRQVA